MRIGNLDDISKSEHSDNLAQLLQTDPTEALTKKEKAQNWWHYHKWYVVLGVFLFGVACSLIGNALGLFTKSPDLQVAYVGRATLPEDTIDALEQAFAALAEDYNGDGEVIAQVNQYVRDSRTTDAETAYYQYAAEVTLIGDISGCESYFFLVDAPQDFQKEYQLLATPDGGCPDQADYSAEDKVIPWAECPLLSEAQMGNYSEIIAGEEITGSNQELLTGLYLGRRCFYNEQASENLEECGALWDSLYESWSAARK